MGLFKKKKRESVEDLYERHQRAVWGKALVVDSRGGLTGETASKAFVTLTMEVTVEGNTYRAYATWLVEITALGFIGQGSELSVKVDIDDPKIIYPNANWATYVR